MSTLAAESQSAGTELPVVAFVRIMLAPLVCAASLALCMLAYGEPYAWRYPILATVAFFVVARVYGEMPLANGGSWSVPRRGMITDWVAVMGVLLLLGFVTK